MQRTITAGELKALMDRNESFVLIDVRRADDRSKDPVAIPGAVWHDPAAVDEWSAGLGKDTEIVLYCVRGGSVSNSVVDALQAKGLDARFVEGGLEAWKNAGVRDPGDGST
jgi:rhodanese-related sulfurtransferase